MLQDIINCIPSFTLLSTIIGILVSMTNVTPVLDLKWFKISTIAMLAAVIILGNAMLLFHQKELIEYYSKCLNLTEKKTKYLLHLNNILLHITVPIILILLIGKQCKISNEEPSWWKSFLVAMGIAGLYFVMMKLKLVSSYGLKNETKIRYFISYVAIILISVLWKGFP